MKTLKRIFTVLLLGVLLVAGFVAYRFYQVATPPQVGGTSFAQLSAEEKTARRRDAQKLTDQIQTVVREAKSGAKKRFVITADENQLNTLLQDRLDTSKFPVRDLRVGLAPQTLSLQGNVTYNGFEATGTLSGNISAQNGVLNYTANELKVQGFSVPKLQNNAEKEINKALEKWSGELPGRIDRVTIEDRKMTIEGTTQK